MRDLGIKKLINRKTFQKMSSFGTSYGRHIYAEKNFGKIMKDTSELLG